MGAAPKLGGCPHCPPFPPFLPLNKLITNQQIKTGIFGGSGFYDFLDKPREITIKTPFGAPSDKITIGECQGKKIAFLPRHGKKHQYPPHQIPYLANLWAFKKIGVERIIAPCAVGSLKPKIKPGDFVIPDQFFNFTKKREDTFFNGPKTAHISSADPYCQDLRNLAVKVSKKLKIPTHSKGTIIVIEGPRFSSRAESKYFSSLADVINMTAYPEIVLAKELEMCYINIALITDYDVGLKNKKSVKPVSAQEVVKIFKENNEKVKKMIFEIIELMPEKRNCPCQNALKNALIN